MPSAPESDPFAALVRHLNNGRCEPFIRQVRFPHYKNLTDQAIDFTYPITAIIGANGTNKSSILRALQACPDQYNIGDFWFDTSLDSIDSGLDKRSAGPQRYIHTYKAPSGHLAEVIKSRVQKSTRGLDYFETERPRIRDGMHKMPNPGNPKDASYRTSTRWSPIKKNVVYLDFRQELPAYDILMHFNWRNHRSGTQSKKSNIRRNSKHVRTALKELESSHTHYGAERILVAARELTTNELRWIRKILAREYSSVRLVKHDFFGVEGWTAMMSVANRTYSEAYAGSGEFAAIMLARSILQAPQRSLILLDEPETSLHPSAQAALLDLLAQECLSRGHQVVISTHSPAMVERLPDTARKLLVADPITGSVQVVSQAASIHESSFRVGAKFSPRTIVVEDALSKELVTRACRIKGDGFLRSFDVVYIPGGASTILNTVVPTQAATKSDCKVLLDGDQRPYSPILPVRDATQIVDSELGTVLAFYGVTKQPKDGGDVPIHRVRRHQRELLSWIIANMAYLPTYHNPERLLAMMCGVTQVQQDYKRFWVDQARSELGILPQESITAEEILGAQRRALAQVPDDNPFMAELLATLNEFLSLL